MLLMLGATACGATHQTVLEPTLSDADVPASMQTADAGSMQDAAPTNEPSTDAAALDGTTASDDAATAVDAGSVSDVPPALVMFADDVRQASMRAQVAGGPRDCATPLPAVPVGSAAEARAVVRNYVAEMFAAPVEALQQEIQPCSVPSVASCASVLNNDAAHFGGPLPNDLYPLAQRVDAEVSDEQLAIFSVNQDTVNQVAIVLSGIQDGYLTGIAFFGDRASCDLPL
jgi:hypothetical protein